MMKETTYNRHGIYAEYSFPPIPVARTEDIKKAPHRANSEEPDNEGTTSMDQATTPGRSMQLPPLAADLEGLAVSLGVLAGNVSPEQWEFLKLFRANLLAAAERVAALENNLGALYE